MNNAFDYLIFDEVTKEESPISQINIDIGESNRPRTDGMTGNGYLDNILLPELIRENKQREQERLDKINKDNKKQANKTMAWIYALIVMIIYMLWSCGN